MDSHKKKSGGVISGLWAGHFRKFVISPKKLVGGPHSDSDERSMKIELSNLVSMSQSECRKRENVKSRAKNMRGTIMILAKKEKRK